MSRNAAKHGTTSAELLHALDEAIASRLPSTWSTTMQTSVALTDSGRTYELDARLTVVAPDGTSAAVLIECKPTLTPRDVDSVARQLEAFAYVAGRNGLQVAGAMVVAPFVSPSTRTRLDERRLGWFDSTGNMRLRLDGPVVFIDRMGAERNDSRDPSDRMLKSLRGSAAAKVVLELAETTLPVGVRELAERAAVGVSSSARILGLLDRETVVDRNDEGAVTVVRKRSLMDRWTQDYNMMTTNEVISALDPRGLGHAMEKLSSLVTPFTVTGSAAARAYLPDDVTPVSPLSFLSVYTEDPVGLMSHLSLRVVDRGANMLVMRPLDKVVHAKSRVVDGIPYAAPAQVVADLLTGPGRSSEEAEQLMAMLESSESGWER